MDRRFTPFGRMKDLAGYRERESRISDIDHGGGVDGRIVIAGGGVNHRFGLDDGVLIKDNHVAAAGGVAAAIERARAYAPHTSRIECEVDTLAQLEVALAAGADIIMLDNFELADMRRAVASNAGRAELEVSGGVQLEQLRDIAATGVDRISVGALTKNVHAVDLSMRILERL